MTITTFSFSFFIVLAFNIKMKSLRLQSQYYCHFKQIKKKKPITIYIILIAMKDVKDISEGFRLVSVKKEREKKGNIILGAF